MRLRIAHKGTPSPRKSPREHGCPWAFFVIREGRIGRRCVAVLAPKKVRERSASTFVAERFIGRLDPDVGSYHGPTQFANASVPQNAVDSSQFKVSREYQTISGSDCHRVAKEPSVHQHTKPVLQLILDYVTRAPAELYPAQRLSAWKDFRPRRHGDTTAITTHRIAGILNCH
jgi:hypothetical protein